MTGPAGDATAVVEAPAGTRRAGRDVLIAIIAGTFQIVVAFVALFGALATADSDGSAPAGNQSVTVTVPAGFCASVIREYRALVRLDPALATSLTTPGPDGVAPIEVDPDARRCGIDADALRAMR
jgi:hypothetical protein